MGGEERPQARAYAVDYDLDLAIEQYQVDQAVEREHDSENCHGEHPSFGEFLKHLLLLEPVSREPHSNINTRASQ
jgi:hypothetical protein